MDRLEQLPHLSFEREPSNPALRRGNPPPPVTARADRGSHGRRLRRATDDAIRHEQATRRDLGIDPDRVFYKGYGKRKPLFSNGTEDGRRRNQRVEIKILRL